jgi:hypothetical protein
MQKWSELENVNANATKETLRSAKRIKASHYQHHC